jgi:tape measure domain-containing protein
MANDVVIRFISQDNASAVALKVAGSLDKVSKSGDTATESAASLGSSIGKIGAAAGIAALGKQMIDLGLNSALVADKFDTVRKALGLMTGSTQAGNELYTVMQDLAARTPFTFDDISQGTQKLLAMGFTAKEIPAVMTAIGDASSAVGGGAEGVNRITLALGQMQAKGKITTEEMMQLQEMGVPAFRILADATGVSQQALMEMVSQGIVPATDNLNTLIAGMEKNYGGMMAQQMDTATQAQSNFQDATDRANQALGEISGPAVKTAFNWLTVALDTATVGMQNFGNWLNWADQSLIRWQLHLQGATEAEIAGALAARDSSAITKEHTQDTYALQRVTGSMTSTTQQATASLTLNTSAMKGTSKASNQLTQDQNKLKSATDSLKTSFLSIASAQRDVTRTREALEDATNPDTLESYQNAADRAYYTNELLTNEITRMTERQKIIRAQLAKGNITQEERNELQAEDAQITEDLIGKNIDAKDSAIALRKAQKDLDRARDPARIQEYADAHTTAKLRLTELQTKQIETIATINELNTKLGANVDVIELVGEAAALTATPLANFDTAGTDIALTYGATNTGVNALLNRTAVSMTTLGQQTPTAAAGITSVGTALGNLAGVDQTKISGINTLASSMSALSSATTSLRGVDFKGILGGVSSAAESLTSAVVARWGTLGTSLNAVATALAKIREENQAGGGGGTDNTGQVAVELAIQGAFSGDKFLSYREYEDIVALGAERGVGVPKIQSLIKDFLASEGSDYSTFEPPIFGRSLPEVPPGMDSKPGNGRIPTDSATRGSQTINITLNYATPPDSKNPLKDVEDYIAAQGGLIRI